MVYRCFSVKKPGFDVEAKSVLRDLTEYLGVTGLERTVVFNRYDVEGIDYQTYKKALHTVFSEPPCDDIYEEEMPLPDGEHYLLAVEALPGQYDQRADSCAQCLQVMTQLDRPSAAYAKVFVFYGHITESDRQKIDSYLINPVDSRKAPPEKPATLKSVYPEAEDVIEIEGFLDASENELLSMLNEYALAMDIEDLKFMQSYFKSEEGRAPTETELRVIDTYWSDHCRHTTFGTHIDAIVIEDEPVKAAYDSYLSLRQELYGDRDRPVTLMDMATIGAKVLKKRGLLDKLDISDEVNACSIHIEATIDGKAEDWLLMFKNETHNHPTEIEPFGGAATCIGGAIRDPLSGRSYVYQAMRVTGSGDPRRPASETLAGKLSQRRLTTEAAAGYSSYGNQIGLATGLVHEVYHNKYIAKRMEVGAVVGAAPASSVVRLEPAPGDKIILLGGRTGRDGCGGAAGSSKTHDLSSLADCAAEVQKGNAPEERKLQRLFRNPSASALIKRCNDFGAGGVCVAIGELADGVLIELDKVSRKYEGLSGTELAVSESQERMAVVVAASDTARFIALAASENLEAAVVAEVTEEKRMIMRFRGREIVSLSRSFLASNGAVKHSRVRVPKYDSTAGTALKDAAAHLETLVTELSFSSQRGLGERFDGSIGAGSVLMPYGGKTQLSPAQVMAALLPVLEGESETCSVMSFAFDPYLSDENPFEAAKQAVITSAAKLVAAGCDYKMVYLSFQEYFERLRDDENRWGKPVSALLGALDAQMGLGIAAIGGKDSMSGSFMDLDVPPTLISFAVAPCEASTVISPEFKSPGSLVYLVLPGDGYESIKESWSLIRKLCVSGSLLSARAVCGEGCGKGAVIGGIFKMAVGNMIGFEAAKEAEDNLLDCTPGAVICETAAPIEGAVLLGHTTEDEAIYVNNRRLGLCDLIRQWESTLEAVFPTRTAASGSVPVINGSENANRCIKAATLIGRKPLAVIPAFPGTNCEYDTARAVKRAGGEVKTVVIKNLTPEMLAQSVDELYTALNESQMLILPGGFSSGDEPEGSGKFIAAFFKNPKLKDAVHELLKARDGLILGICNGFQALIKLGLVPYGEIRDVDAGSPTLTFNEIGRHQSRYVTTRVCTADSAWLHKCQPGMLYTVPVSHGEGRFMASEDFVQKLIEKGQIATQYTDNFGSPSMETYVNPNGSLYAIEGILSPDGRILGKMAHSERAGRNVAKNIPGNLCQPIFESGVDYFKL